ncbi:MAG: MFS transporter [Pseudomonadales bacterium]
MKYRTLIVLTAAQAFAQTGAPIVVLLGGIVGAMIAPADNLVTLPIALMIVGTAASTVPAALIMSKFGRKAGFLFGGSYACGAGVLAAWAIEIQNFWLFCVATFVIGSHNAFVQQYRFAVAESVPAHKVGPAVSILMLAGVAAAFTGPEVASRLHALGPWGLYSGSFLGLSALMLAAIVLLTFYPGSKLKLEEMQAPQRGLSKIALQPVFLLAVGAAVVGYAVMSLVMTATPVAMHTHDHFSLNDTKIVIQSHIVAMYLPSLFSGFLIARFGSMKIIGVGLALIMGCLVIAFVDRGLMHYWWALVLLGVGWNFLFVGGTTLLTSTYQPGERFKVQALNDFLIFGLQAVAALGSGVILASLGWEWILGLSLPWLVLLLPVMWMAARVQRSPT